MIQKIIQNLTIYLRSKTLTVITVVKYHFWSLNTRMFIKFNASIIGLKPHLFLIILITYSSFNFSLHPIRHWKAAERFFLFLVHPKIKV